MGNANRALVCHSRSDPATLPFSKVIHVCLFPAVCVVIRPCVVHVGPQCVIVTPCIAVKTSCPSPGQLKGGFETAAWIASLCKCLRLALAMVKLNCFSLLNDLLCLWPGFCVCWASPVLHPEVAPFWYHVHLSPWFLVKPERQPSSWRMEGTVINVNS